LFFSVKNGTIDRFVAQYMIKFDTSMGEKAIWDAANVKLFCDLCTKEVNVGHRPLGHLNKVGWKNIEVKFAEVTGKKLEHLQMKNKWDNLKRSYTIFMELKNSATGLGWNEMRQTVDCDDCWDHASSPKVLQKETASAEAART
jgi:hypothetical protein